MGTLILWVVFNLFVLVMLALDLGVFHRRAHTISLREATFWSVVWVVVALAFNASMLFWYGPPEMRKTPALEFLTGYVIERSLSVDNIFVFLLIFNYFGVEARHQYRVLYWGILGALIMRGAMIAAGVTLITRFHWVLYLFGIFLVYAGAKMLFQKTEEIHPERNPVLRGAKKYLPITNEYHGQNFFVRQGGIWRATPLFLVLLVVETTDLAFALDSIPAIFGITRDPFIIYSSNVFAILGLRALYFLLVGVLPYFRYLSTGLAVVLMFIGVKMLVEHWVRIATHWALAVVGVVLGAAVIASVVAARAEARALRKARRPAERPALPETAGAAALVRMLGDADPTARAKAARRLHAAGSELSHPALIHWLADAELAALLRLHEPPSVGKPARPEPPVATVGVAVLPETFEKIRAANGSPQLADVPPDQDAQEFALHFDRQVRLDILTTKELGGKGAIARFLQRFGEGIQQVEYETIDVDRATEILRTRFGQKAIYPQTRPGADGSRVNFFLASAPEGKKVLIELVEVSRTGKS